MAQHRQQSTSQAVGVNIFSKTLLSDGNCVCTYVCAMSEVCVFTNTGHNQKSLENTGPNYSLCILLHYQIPWFKPSLFLSKSASKVSYMILVFVSLFNKCLWKNNYIPDTSQYLKNTVVNKQTWSLLSFTAILGPSSSFSTALRGILLKHIFGHPTMLITHQ